MACRGCNPDYSEKSPVESGGEEKSIIKKVMTPADKILFSLV